MPTSDEPRAAPSPGAYAGHQMIELERLGACPAECRGRIVRLQATWLPSFASAGGHFLRPSLRPQVVLAPSSRAAQWRLWLTCCSDAHPLLPVRSTTSSGEGRSSGGLCSPMAPRHRSGSGPYPSTTTRTARRHMATSLPETLP